jgi:hypothetical protein
MALQWTRRPRIRSGRSLRSLGSPPNMALQRTRRPRLRSGRSLRSLGSPLNARPFGAAWKIGAAVESL